MLNTNMLYSIVQKALHEEGFYDVTTLACDNLDRKMHMNILAQEDCILCGIQYAKMAFYQCDKQCKFLSYHKDGDLVQAGTRVCDIQGKYESLLFAERVALNFLSHLSGISSLTHAYIKHIKPYTSLIAATRKTLPGLRNIQKYAVHVAGGLTHRTGLEDCIMIKDNHITCFDNIENVVEKILKNPSLRIYKKLIIEIDSLDQFDIALQCSPDIILCDNMSPENINKCVTYQKRKCLIEASGGINKSNIKKYASSGADILSIGELTMSPPYINFSCVVS